MALSIVRNDIVKMQVDAIVNSTNEHFQVGGLGVDAGIHHAAGPRLAQALAKIGSCPVGSAVITEAYDIPTCKYIIHTVGPVYRGGRYGEPELLRRCYRNILALAREHDCRSVAIPSISSGAYAYPKEAAYKIATSCIREFLLSLPEDEDMMIYLVLFDQASVNYAATTGSDVESYIPAPYPKAKKSGLSGLFKRNAAPAPANRVNMDATVAYSVAPMSFDSTPAAKRESYADQDLSFADMCEWWCEQKGISKKEFYISSNINKSMFWNMKHHPDQTPRKTNVLACAIGLRLNYAEAQDLLMRAGMTLSPYYALDRAVTEFIRRNNYDIFDINEQLFEKDLPLLGAC